ncbi:hypothetical protein DYB32_007582 [Aphanomyces invadans]|uniref:DUSP domain-containing protein n=1 Tax=Aphanomyces invadans TaxID=157072 RepID=A0A418ANF1_9STRA|nr:hypothetical protein DYB32_007582 [Aphanomyces invadans]
MPSDRARDLVLYLSRVIQLLTYRRLFSTDIMAFLDINFCKVRSEEEALSADALNRIAPVLEGSIVFLVGSSWMSQWRNFVLDKDGMSPPGPISNEDLLDEHGMPKKHMVAPRHYRFLSAPGTNVMQNIQSLLQLKVTQNRHSAAVTIQQAYKRYKHRVLYADDIPVKTTVVPEVEVDYFTLQEIGLIDDDETRLVQFIHTMQKGVAILKLSSRYKPTPKLKFFKLDRIGSQLMWTCKAKPTPKSIVLAHVQRIAIEAPVALKSVLGLRPKQTAVLDHGVVMTLADKEVVLVADSKCACNALYFGLQILIKEGKVSMTAPNHFDEDGVMRRQLVHAKDLVRQALVVHDDLVADL